VTQFHAFTFAAGLSAPTLRNMPDRIVDIVNVKEFGATGLGFPNDDLAAINLAITQIQNQPFNPGSILFFPPGVYYVSAGFVPGSNGYGIEIHGSGRDCTKITGNVFTANSPDGTTPSYIVWTFGQNEGLNYVGNITIENQSVIPGSGALLMGFTSKAFQMENSHLIGMIPFDGGSTESKGGSFGMSVRNCIFSCSRPLLRADNTPGTNFTPLNSDTSISAMVWDPVTHVVTATTTQPHGIPVGTWLLSIASNPEGWRPIPGILDAELAGGGDNITNLTCTVAIGQTSAFTYAGNTGLTGTLTNPFVTTNTSNSVTVNHSGSVRLVGDKVTFSGASTFNNVNMNGTFTVVTTDVNGNFYTVTAGTTANASGSGGGTVTYAYGPHAFISGGWSWPQTVGAYNSQGIITACQVNGGFNIGLTHATTASVMLGNVVKNCGYGIYTSQRGDHGWTMAGGDLLGNTIANCGTGIFLDSFSQTRVMGNTVSGKGNGYYAPAPIASATWSSGGGGVVTVTTTAAHNIQSNQKIQLLNISPTIWDQSTDGLNSVTLNGANSFKYPAASDPTGGGSTPFVSGNWTYPTSAAILIGNSNNSLIAANHLSAVCSDASYDAKNGNFFAINVNLTCMSMRGPYGFIQALTSFAISATQTYLMCGIPGSSPPIPNLLFQDLPGGSDDTFVIGGPFDGQEISIIDGQWSGDPGVQPPFGTFMFGGGVHRVKVRYNAAAPGWACLAQGPT
jgi:hypothetical protein